ncbi:MAG: ATP synthase F1 subunit gamma [Bacteroidales bacterium]|jgi:F-type H+-transporting ATPase subunit gamma|nr:ATP synthase F1 subunit gamma [Bacteroidales bacterium]
MANLKEIRTRIESVESTQQITTAMRMVSASKLRKAQLAFSTIQPYAQNLLFLTRNIANLFNKPIKNSVDIDSHEKEKALDNVLLFVFSSNRGLCGAFNSNIAKYVRELIRTKYHEHLEQGRLSIMAAGRRIGDILEKESFPITATYHDFLNKIDYKEVCLLSNELLEKFEEGTYQKIVFIYNKFKTVLTQELTEEQFLPILPPEMDETNAVEEEYIMEPNKEDVARALYPKVLSIHLYRTFLGSLAAEEGARMTAMQQASDNASVLLKELKITYNKERQAAITNELIEIISGSETLKNG